MREKNAHSKLCTLITNQAFEIWREYCTSRIFTIAYKSHSSLWLGNNGDWVDLNWKDVDSQANDCHNSHASELYKNF